MVKSTVLCFLLLVKVLRFLLSYLALFCVDVGFGVFGVTVDVLEII